MLERLTKGKQAELYVFGELLRRGVVPYVPMADIEGIDAVIRGASRYLELQVKSSATLKSPRWFQVGRLTPRQGYFLVCVNLTAVPAETWVIPSEEFHRYATRSTDKKGRTTCDLDLDSASRQEPDRKRREILSQYKDAWHLLAQGASTFLPAGDNSEWSRVSEPAFGEEWSSHEDEEYDKL
ncbi:MAG TPA: hypothetical protein VJ578_00690 [Dehalococcoidia bacterium]|nr:hypothetical protein [Dehalococcoidia bacterium]